MARILFNILGWKPYKTGKLGTTFYLEVQDDDGDDDDGDDNDNQVLYRSI